MQHTLELVGTLAGDPATLNGAKSVSLDLAFKTAFPKCAGASTTLTAAPLNLALGGLISARLFAIKVLDGSSVLVTVSSAAGVNQVLRVSGLWVWYSPVAGDALTSITLTGPGEVEYLIAGV